MNLTVSSSKIRLAGFKIVKGEKVNDVNDSTNRATVREPEFQGEGRQAIVDGILAAFDEISTGAAPIWISIEAPQGTGKTRIAREFYAALAGRQTEPAYWPRTMLSLHHETGGVAARRKVVNPVVTHQSGSLPTYMWWGVSTSIRNSVPTVALSQDLSYLQAHAAYLDLAWLEKSRGHAFKQLLREFGVAGFREAGDELKTQILAAAGATIPGLGLVEWLASRAYQAGRNQVARTGQLRREDAIAPDHGDLITETVATVGRFAVPALPFVLFVEDLHTADETLIELLDHLAGGNASVLIVTTAWNGHIDPGSSTGAAMAGARTIRITPDGVLGDDDGLFPLNADLGPLPEAGLAEILKFYFPRVTSATSARILAKYPNPLALELFCEIPKLKRFQARELELTENDLLGMPDTLHGLYKEQWDDLDEPVRRGLVIAALGIPELINHEHGRATEWSSSLLLDVIEKFDAGEIDESAGVLDGRVSSRAWARPAAGLDLWQFAAAEQRQIAAADDALLWESDRREVRKLLTTEVTRALDPRNDDPEPNSPRSPDSFVARLAIALHAAGYEIPPSTLQTAIFMLLVELDSYREFPERLKLITYALEAGIESRELLRSYMSALADSHRTDEAVAVGEELIGRWGSDDADTAHDRMLLADVLTNGALGDNLRSPRPELARRAVLEYRTTLSFYAALVPFEDYLIFRIRAAIARALWFSGDIDQAREDYSVLLEDARRVLGDDHPLTRDIATKSAGLSPDGLRVMLALWAQELATLPASSEEALKLRADMAVAVWEEDIFEEAITRFEEVVQDQIRILGPKHNLTLQTQGYLAQALGMAERYPESLRVHLQVLGGLRETLPPDHTDVLSARAYIADVLEELGDDSALSARLHLIDDQSRVLGADHRETVESADAIARLQGVRSDPPR
ncbi:tetratricopeptide repeat protein [Cryobacterium soli]|uniref:tetratricopeptide repeat protein n=1 Tax=Cryobacterium soli TaxID=2220095 RepID=UPI000E7098FF|nr:tetratricopeptide repeat protein [Cryobacterium soli]